jgi:hypothetical protein
LALNSRSIIHPKWYTHNRAAERSLELCDIEIYNPASAQSVYDPATNTWSDNSVLLWEGKARIQPRSASVRLGTAGNLYTAIDPGASQIMEIHIGLKENQLAGSDGEMPDIRPGHRMLVTASPIDPSLLNFEFVVRSVLNSSNPWHRMLLCEVNQELNPNNNG